MSMVSKSHKYVYVSGGRNATGSIRAALLTIPDMTHFEPAKLNKGDWRLYDKHMPARHIKRVIGSDLWNKCFKFTFVRNPFSWVVSSFFFWVKVKRSQMPANGIMTMDNFEEVVSYYRTDVGRRYDECSPIRSQHSFICNAKGKVMVDFVGRFENLQSDFDTVCECIGVKPITLLKQNTSQASRGVDWREHYRQNPGAKRLVETHWGRDLKAFNYTLEL